MKKILLAFSLLCYVQVFSLDTNHFTITRISAPYFIVDANSPATINKAYVGFEITNNSNSGVTYSNLKFSISSIGTTVAGQDYGMVSPANGLNNIGTLAPGASKVCYFYVSYPASTTPQATFNVLLTDTTASFKTQSFVIRNRSSISANAGGTATQSFSNQDLIGAVITDDVTYAVGNVQNGDEGDFQVAVSAQFDPTKVSLIGTQVISSNVPGVTAGTTDSLYFITGNGSNGATVTIRWTFRITGFNFTTYLLPCAGATSGSTNYKYALNTTLGSGTPVTVSAGANPLTISKTSDKAIYLLSSPAVFTITIQNPGAYPVTIDRITDTLPTGFIFTAIDVASQVTAANSTSIPVAGVTGAVSFEGGTNSYSIAAGGSLIIKYRATSGLISLSGFVTTVKDFVGATQVGSAQNVLSVGVALPIKLVSFKAVTAKVVDLNWQTSNEINAGMFEIERSAANAGFTKIGMVTATNTGAAISNYKFADADPLPGFNYYRLKMIDHDGRFEYSPVINTKWNEKDFSILSVYPNPFVDHINLSIACAHEGTVVLQLRTADGKTVISKDINCRNGLTSAGIDNLGSLKPGAYWLCVVDGEKLIQVKLLKAAR